MNARGDIVKSDRLAHELMAERKPARQRPAPHDPNHPFDLDIAAGVVYGVLYGAVIIAIIVGLVCWAVR